MYAFDARSGRLRWRADVGGRVQGGPITVTNAVLVGSGNGTLYAFDKASGSERYASK